MIRVLITGCSMHSYDLIRALKDIITHVIVQRGKPRAERTDRLILGNRVFYIVDIDDTGSLGVSTLYYAEERTDVK